MEPDRKIEKLLRACAKKRRSEPGATPELHPATRRLLQAEVSRRTARPEREGFFFLRFLGDCRPQLAAILGVVVVGVFGFAMFMPTLAKSKTKAQSVAAMNNLKQIGIAAILYAQDNTNRLPAALAQLMTTYLKSTNVLMDPMSRKPFVYIGAGRKLDDLSPGEPLAYSPADRKGRRAVLFVDGHVQWMGSRPFAELAEENALLIASLGEDSKVMPVNKRSWTGLDGATLSAGGRNPNSRGRASVVEAWHTQEYVRVASDGKPLADSMTAGRSRETTPVMASFLVRNFGTEFEVVDIDGSLYEGRLRAVSADAQPPAAHVFNVSGTNLTWKQPLVFTGRLLPMPNKPAPGRESTAVAPALRLADWQISGTAVLGQTNLIEITALPR